VIVELVLRLRYVSTLSLTPSFDGFDGGAGSRYQARREMTSFWYPTWLAQPAAWVEGSKSLDCPPHDTGVNECLKVAKEYEHVILHTSTPSLPNDCRVAEAIKDQKPKTTIKSVGAHAAVLPTETLKASKAIDWAGRKEFDFTCKEVAEGREHRSDAQVYQSLSQGRHDHARNVPSFDAVITSTRLSPFTSAVQICTPTPEASSMRCGM
tara:strand:- start:196 stop:822 length:627 start_codon:yes stop_codon:yes gene_type:complete